MRLKLFRAPTVSLAITQVRRELGADALILSTRRVQDGVEVTAALEGDAVPPPAPSAPIAPPTQSRLAWHGVPPELQARLEAGPLEDMLAATLRFGALPLGPGAPPLLLTGPPGAGKTLTTARLATRLTLAGTPPLVVTADGRRAGAAEQLAAFTRVLGLPLLVADEPVALSRALARRERGAPALIDSAGLDPFDPHEREELAGLGGPPVRPWCWCCRPAWTQPSPRIWPAHLRRQARRCWCRLGWTWPGGWAVFWLPPQPDTC